VPAAPFEVVVEHEALAKIVAPRVAARWSALESWLAACDEEQRTAHGGRAPDFGDARAILAAVDAPVERRIAMLGDADVLRVRVDAGDDDVHAELTLVPSQGGGPAARAVEAMHPGDAQPLASAPLDALAAVLVRDDAAARASDAQDVDAALEKTFGTRLGDADAKKLRGALDAWAKGRGDWVTVAVPWGEQRGVLVRAPVVDADAATSAVRDLVALGRRPVLAEPLAALLRVHSPTVATVDVPGFGKAQMATFTHDKDPAGFAVAWGVAGGEISVAASDSASTMLGPPLSRLGDDPKVARSLAAVGSRASLVVLAQPMRIDHARVAGRPERSEVSGAGKGAAPQPAVLAWGRDGYNAWARVQLAGAVVREIVKQAAGF
jgi:hypothetical protein